MTTFESTVQNLGGVKPAGVASDFVMWRKNRKSGTMHVGRIEFKRKDWGEEQMWTRLQFPLALVEHGARFFNFFKISSQDHQLRRLGVVQPKYVRCLKSRD